MMEGQVTSGPAHETRGNKKLWVGMGLGFLSAFLCICGLCALLYGMVYVRAQKLTPMDPTEVQATVSMALTQNGTPLFTTLTPTSTAFPTPDATPASTVGAVPTDIQDEFAIRIGTEGRISTKEPFRIRFQLQGDNLPPEIYLVAFRKDVSLLIAAPLSPSPTDYGVEYPDGGRVFLAQYAGVPSTTPFVFEARAYSPGRWEGELVICFSPQVSSATCRVIPLSIVVPE